MTKMWKLALATFVAIALVAGFTGTSATAAPVRAAAGQSAERANECGQQQSRLAQTQRNAKIKRTQFAKAGKVLKQANKRLQKAKKSGQKALIKNAKKGVKRAKVNKAVKARNLKKARSMVASAARQLRACQQAGGGGGTAGPLQPVCDAGLPQAVCDAVDSLPLPGGIPGAASPIQTLCDAGLPQAICDAATNLPVPGADNPIQALCDAGLPQGICDLAGGNVGLDTLPIPGGLPGIPDFPAFPGIPDVPGLDTLLALLSPLTNQLPLGTVCDTLDIPVVCDLVG